jgi:hypothetical protein
MIFTGRESPAVIAAVPPVRNLLKHAITHFIPLLGRGKSLMVRAPIEPVEDYTII